MPFRLHPDLFLTIQGMGIDETPPRDWDVLECNRWSEACKLLILCLLAMESNHRRPRIKLHDCTSSSGSPPRYRFINHQMRINLLIRRTKSSKVSTRANHINLTISTRLSFQRHFYSETSKGSHECIKSASFQRDTHTPERFRVEFFEILKDDGICG